MKRIIWVIIIAFLIVFIWRSFLTMVNVPLHDFDEANRAETARNMDIYRSYFAPLNGSPFEQEKEYEKAKNNPLLKVHYHLERPPFYYLTMILSSRILGDSEFAYRLPSMIFGLSTLIIFAIVTFPMTIPVLTFITSTDWWLSSQSALMDTSLTFFLFIGFLCLLKFVEKKQKLLLILSGVSVGLAVLSKGQPAAIYMFPLLYLLIKRRIKLSDVLTIIAVIFVTVSPWIIANSFKFGTSNFLSILLDFARKRSMVTDATQEAPVYWYARWWIESFRIGWLAFITLLFSDFIGRRIDYRRATILTYIVPSFLLFSLSKNKVWWYVMPLVPIVALYIHESIVNVIKRDHNKLVNLSLVILLFSLPIGYSASNKISLILAFLMVVFALLIFRVKFRLSGIAKNIMLVASVIFTLTTFNFRFPTINPTYPEIKALGKQYQSIKQPKCLFVYKMPYEAVLHYSKSEQVNYYDANMKLNKNCINYLITPEKFTNFDLITSEARLNLYKIN